MARARLLAGLARHDAWTTVLVGVASLALILGLRRLAPRVPGALVLVAGGLAASAIFDLGAHGVALVGEVPRGLPAPELPDAELVADHAGVIVIAAVALLLIGFSQTAGDARAFAARHRYRIDIDQESVAQGDGERRRRACSRACPSRRASRPARSTRARARARRRPRS